MWNSTRKVLIACEYLLFHVEQLFLLRPVFDYVLLALYWLATAPFSLFG